VAGDAAERGSVPEVQLHRAACGERKRRDRAAVHVPQGYDGVISSLVQQYTGTGFVDGSGDLKWRIRIGDRWAEDMGNMITQLGSLQSPYQIYRSGIRLRDRDAVSYVVNHAVGSSLSGGRIICGCFGWYYPTA
jgi:hypothetical protein